MLFVCAARAPLGLVEPGIDSINSGKVKIPLIMGRDGKCLCYLIDITHGARGDSINLCANPVEDQHRYEEFYCEGKHEPNLFEYNLITILPPRNFLLKRIGIFRLEVDITE